MRKGRVLIAAPVHPVLIEGLTEAGYDLVHAEDITQEKAYGLISHCVGVITSTRLHLNRDLIEAAPLLKWIGRMGSGMEVIDVPFAESKGIFCFSSPEGNANAVAEHALGMLLSLTKRITWSHNEVKEGKWLREENRGIELDGKTIGIIGFGHTGSTFAKKLSGFDMKILAYDKYHPENIPAHVHNCSSLDPIYAEADIISFHVPLQADTIHYFNDDFARQMRKKYILVNTSRGDVVDTESVLKGINEERIAGACLDVVEGEPLTCMSEDQQELVKEFMRLPQMVVTPHIAGYTHEALYKMSKILLDAVSFARKF